jgi:hypothetical protein
VRYNPRSRGGNLSPLTDLSRKRKNKLLNTLNIDDFKNINDGGSTKVDFSNYDDSHFDIEEENPNDDLRGLDLENYVDDTSNQSLYPTQFDTEYDYNNQITRPNQHGVAYYTSNLGNKYSLGRFDDILKAKKNRSK